jgi:hypothetical protein
MSRQETSIEPDQRAIGTVKDKDLRKLERDGYAVMAGVMAFGEMSQSGRMARIVHACQLLVIAFAFITPVYLFWKVVF